MMTKRTYLTIFSTALVVGATLAAGRFAQGLAEPAEGESASPLPRKSATPAKIGHPSLLSPPIAVHGGRVFVANTPADTVDVIDTKTRKVIARIHVGIDPVSISVRPDGEEIWVANHVSDSVSVIDNSPTSPTYLRVIATVQDFLPIIRSTRFDEPVGIAFAGNTKAYVALSSENTIAVVNVATRKVTKRIEIPAQDPRAIVVRGERLYVIPFESNNKTQLSGGYKIDGDLVTFNAHEHSIANNNVLSLGHVLDIVKHPKVPDHDLFVYDTTDDRLIETVDTLGTLLYGLAVDSNGRVFVAQTDARNDANGRSGTKKHGLAELQNRAFLNQITSVEFDGDSAEEPSFINLEPLPPIHPEPGMALATPFAIQVSDDDSFLIASAAGSDKVFTVDATSGDVLGQVKVGSVPRGIALRRTEAWVLNAVGNSVSLVDISEPAKLAVAATIPLQDPTHPIFKRGRMAFNTAAASTTKTFSCASCHPDGHTDQLLWVLKTPIVTGGNQIMPRSTMPLRGLRDTAPFHWDGIPGDPFGGNNSASVHAHVDPNCSADDPADATRHLVDAGLASTMAMDGDTRHNDEDKPGLLTASERDDLAKFLLNIPFPPAQKRPYTNVLSERAVEGFELFHIKGNHEGKPRPNVCGDCHRMPFLVSTNTPGSGMDAPTWRGAYDRFLILPQGRLNIIDFDFYRRIAERGIPEREMWRFSWRSKPRFDPVWDMVLQGSTGFSGAFARQVTVSSSTAEDKLTVDLLEALEASAREGAIVLQAEGVLLDADKATPITLQFQNGSYFDIDGDGKTRSREDLLTLAKESKFIGTFTGRHGENADYDHPQPAIWTLGPIQEQRGRQDFPILYGQKRTMAISGRHVRDGASVIVDGRKVVGSVKIEPGEKIVIALSELPAVGMHLLQVQNPHGLFSNDFIFHVAKDESEAAKKRNETNPGFLSNSLGQAIRRGDLAATKRLVRRGAGVNARHAEDGSIPLSTAALHGNLEITNYLIEQKARINHTNRDGNTPLHVAAFLCRAEVVKLLLAKGASTRNRNDRRESPIDVVSGDWSEELGDFYSAIAAGSGFKIDLEEIEKLRPQIADLLRDHAANPK